ncbi:hypothetical protein ABZ733_08320 [Streptomyces longwoodensis]|uniref:hypothetical protein n=1 Tax=Streptomyces longwoodensis TaxID=68231 RepID=UPI00340C2B54
MSSTDRILQQIDSAVNDWTVSADAMRCTPTPAPASAPSAEPPAAGQPGLLFTHAVLARRLADHHGLDLETASRAVIAVAQGEPTPHTDLVRAEARAEVARLARIFAQLREAFRPLVEAWIRSFREIGEYLHAVRTAAADAARSMHHSTPTPRRSRRPAWQSPYGPQQRRRK